MTKTAPNRMYFVHQKNCTIFPRVIVVSRKQEFVNRKTQWILLVIS